jgi:hypothetical protein
MFVSNPGKMRKEHIFGVCQLIEIFGSYLISEI